MGLKLEDFEVLETIGRGSHGTIRKVRRKCDGELLVWKELHYASMNEAEKQGLVLEVNLLRELYHPNIVRFFNHLVDRHTGMLYIFMEYCPGGDLLHLVSKCRKTGSFLEEGFIWRVLKQVCEALRACHDKHTKDGAIILHRDIKPANVFLDKDGNIKVGDFGLARTLNSDASFARTFVGTPYYMSPEVIDGRAYNEQSDIWSLGCLVYELCSLEPPFKATSQSDLYNKIKAGKCKRIPIHYSNELWEIIQEMLTLEDFLRPGAFLILHHSTLKKNTASKIEVVDDSVDSLLLSLDLNNDAIAIKSAVIVYDEEDSSYLNSLNNTVKERERSAEEIRMEESLMKEVEMMLKESQLRKEKEKNERLQGNKLNINSLLTTTKRQMSISNKTEMSKSSEERSQSWCLQERIEKELSPPKCICGGTTWEEWKERLSLVRASETDVKKREMEVEERERELAKRERRIQAMEQEVKQHLVRAQIYLKQAKIKIPNHHLIPKLERVEELSDFDATTVSADIGYEEKSTVAYLDTEARNNPFLKMRENKSNVIKFNTKLNRSNTLDNPKSRRKHGNYFYLDKENKIPDCNKQKLERIVASNERTTKDIKLHGIQNENKSKAANDQKKGLNPNIRRPLITLSNENKNGLNSKGSAKTFLNNFRQNLAKHNIRNPGKENKQSFTSASEQKSKPLKVINSIKFQSKGVCAKPTNLQPQIIDNPSMLGQKFSVKDRMLRVYNDV